MNHKIICISTYLLFIIGTLSMQILSSKLNDEYFVYGDVPTTTALIPKDLYRAVVESLVITCIDVFIYDPLKKTYLLAKRTSEPAKGLWWLPGGRLCKGESFVECAVRKSKTEMGLNIAIPDNALLGVYSTVFDKSAFNCPTHTVNIAVLALYNSHEGSLNLDAQHSNWRWVPIAEKPEDPYVNAVYQQALLKIQ